MDVDRLVFRADTRRVNGNGLQALAREVEGAQEGNRNNLLFWAAARAAEEGSSLDEIAAVLTPAALEAGLEHAETERTIRSGVATAKLAAPTERPFGPGDGQTFEEWGAEMTERYGAPPDPPRLIVGITEYRQGVPERVPWIAEPLVYAGGVTLLSGPPKKGKSTLAAQLMRCRETGEPFLDRHVKRGPTLLATEEAGVAVLWKTAGLAQLDVLDRPTAVRAGIGWADTLNVIADWARAHSDGLVFLDTIAIWAGIDDENDASRVTQRLADVTVLAAETQLGVVLIHHTRKSGGAGGVAIRGSGAMLATVDISIELSVVDEASDDRFLDVQGRVLLPERMRLAFDRDGLSYARLDLDTVRLEEIEALLAGIPATGEGMSKAQLQDVWDIARGERRIERLLNIGRLRRSGEKVKLGPRKLGYLYWSIPAATAIGRGAEEGAEGSTRPPLHQ